MRGVGAQPARIWRPSRFWEAALACSATRAASAGSCARLLAASAGGVYGHTVATGTSSRREGRALATAVRLNAREFGGGAPDRRWAKRVARASKYEWTLLLPCGRRLESVELHADLTILAKLSACALPSASRSPRE